MWKNTTKPMKAEIRKIKNIVLVVFATVGLMGICLDQLPIQDSETNIANHQTEVLNKGMSAHANLP